jgi:hypothetical protein
MAESTSLPEINMEYLDGIIKGYVMNARKRTGYGSIVPVV